MIFSKCLVLFALFLFAIILMIYKIDSIRETKAIEKIDLISNDCIERIVILSNYSAMVTIKKDCHIPVKSMLLEPEVFENSIIKTQRYRDIEIYFYSSYLDYYTKLDTNIVEKMYAKIRKDI